MRRSRPPTGRRCRDTAALVTIAALACGSGCRDRARTAGVAPDPQKEKIRAFWTDYHDATAARTKGSFASAAQGYKRALERDPRHEDSLFYLAEDILSVAAPTTAPLLNTRWDRACTDLACAYGEAAQFHPQRAAFWENEADKKIGKALDVLSISRARRPQRVLIHNAPTRLKIYGD